MSQSRGTARSARRAVLSYKEPTVVPVLDSVSQAAPIKVIKKYWKPDPMNAPDYSRPFQNWHPASTFPLDGTLVLARIKGTNRHTAAKWVEEHKKIFSPNYQAPIEVEQWITFAEFAEIKYCAWRRNAE